MIDIMFVLENHKDMIFDKEMKTKYFNYNDDLIFIRPSNVFLTRFKDLGIGTFIKGMFNLSNPYFDTGLDMILYWLSSSKPKTVKIGNYNKKFTRRDGFSNYAEMFRVPKSYHEYLNNIEKWIDGSDMPKDIYTQEQKELVSSFNEINHNEFNYTFTYPNYYSKEVIKIRNQINDETSIVLEKVADIIRPREKNPVKPRNNEKRKKGPTLSTSAFEYPLNYRNVKNGILTDHKLSKGDIIVIRDRFYLIYEQPRRTIYAPYMSLIIKPHSISPEYLYVYLQSDMFKKILFSLKADKMNGLKEKNLKKLPIILPKRSDEFYKKSFELIYLKPISLNPYNDYFSNYAEPDNNILVQDAFDLEMFKTTKITKYDTVHKMIIDDLNELNACFKAKAYKATLVMTGSILEAFLIDWLSEIKRKDFFKNPYWVKKYNEKRGYYWTQASLSDYIDEIGFIEHPKWEKEKQMAHTIRHKRNNVHAKLGINSNDINKETCEMVIEYLQYVIETRIKL